MISLSRSAASQPPSDCPTRPYRGALLALALQLVCCSAYAVDVGLAGLFPGKALLTVNGGPPRIVAIGAKTEEGITVVSVQGDTATLDVEGKKRVLRVGQNVASQPSGQGSPKVVLTADTTGHFLTTGNINGATVRFLVDTGATLVSIGAAEAKRIGIDPSKGRPVMVNTANGQAQATQVKVDTVRVGEIVMHNVDAIVQQTEMPVVLLGMSFLNRMEMVRDGDTMTLKKRY